jgi:hypothetical protein
MKGFNEPLEQAEGWAAIDGMATAAREANQKQFEQHLDMASNYRQALASPAGAAMLQDLCRMFLFQDIVKPGDPEHAAGIRQGQQHVVRRMLAMIDFANTGGGRITGTKE